METSQHSANDLNRQDATTLQPQHRGNTSDDHHSETETEALIALLDQRFAPSSHARENFAEQITPDKSNATASKEHANRENHNSNFDGIGDKKPLGLTSFNLKDQEQWGRSTRLAMACINSRVHGSIVETADDSFKTNRHQVNELPRDRPTIARQLKSLTRDLTSNLYDQIELLVRFDDLEGWRESGCKHCVAWINAELSISPSLAWEYLRVGRELRNLPVLAALFQVGSLGWSKVRQISRVADEENECLLCHAALDASVSDVERMCRDYRWQNEEIDQETLNENARAMQQFAARSLTWRQASNGNTEFRLCLPPEMAQGFLRSIDFSLEQLDNRKQERQQQPEEAANNESPESPRLYIRQQRADAAVLMAERNLLNAGRDISIADRFQVVVSVDANELQSPLPERAATNNNTRKITNSTLIPSKRPVIEGTGPIARETARRIACDCSTVMQVMDRGEPLNIGRKTRQWPPAMARAIRHRDKHCQFKGCNSTHHLQIHHIVHWADGGSTSIDNGVCLCSEHHRQVHEGGLSLQRVRSNPSLQDRQFQDQRTTEATTCEAERALRNSRASFEAAKSLTPDCHRFNIVKPISNLIEHAQATGDSTRVDYSMRFCASGTAESLENQSGQSDGPLDKCVQSTHY